MKIMTILGTRPEFIRLSLIIKKLNSYLQENHIIVNTNQNFSHKLSDIFRSLYVDVHRDDWSFSYNLNLSGSFGKQAAILFEKLEEIIEDEKPDRFFVLGDTNSSLGGIIAKRMGIRVFHLEAGNRSFDVRMPEEVNRKLIDHCSDILMTYSQNSKRLLLNEGFRENQVFCVGNPIFEVIEYFKPQIDASRILDYYRLEKNKYSLCTLHRSENIDNPERLKEFLIAINFLANEGIIVMILHPHLKKVIGYLDFGFRFNDNIKLIEPVDFFDFINLEMNANVILTDSGTVQEECNILGKKCLVLRDSSERWETLESGSCIITGCNAERIKESYEYMRFRKVDLAERFEIIKEYQEKNVSEKVVRLLLNNYLW